MRGLEIGVNDYLMRPIDQNELLARVRTQVRKKRYTERLRDNVQMSIEMAITDALTGLHNRRYMESHLGTLVEQAAARGKPLTVLVLDIDYFKAINDSYGHDAGDDVLREFALRIRKSIRGIDLACRYGGEEFVVVMPETDMAVATMVAERLRRRIAAEPFPIQQGARSDRRSRSRSASPRWRPSDSAAQRAQARRPGALSRQARRPQPGGRRTPPELPSAVAAARPLSAGTINRRLWLMIAKPHRLIVNLDVRLTGSAVAVAFDRQWRWRQVRGAHGGPGRPSARSRFALLHDNPTECSGPPHLLGPWGSAGSGAVRVASSYTAPGRPPFPVRRIQADRPNGARGRLREAPHGRRCSAAASASGVT